MPRGKRFCHTQLQRGNSRALLTERAALPLLFNSKEGLERDNAQVESSVQTSELPAANQRVKPDYMSVVSLFSIQMKRKMMAFNKQ